MVQLPSCINQYFHIDPNTEYDAMIQTPPRRATHIFHLLSEQKTKYVSVSVKDNGGVKQVSFIKDRGDPNVILDRGTGDPSSDEDVNIVYDENAYRYQFSCSDDADRVQFEREKREIEREKTLALRFSTETTEEMDIYGFGSSVFSVEKRKGSRGCRKRRSSGVLQFAAEAESSDDGEIYVSISVKNNGGVDQVSFIKDRGAPNVILDRGSDGPSSDEDVNIIYDEDAYRYQISCSHNAEHAKLRKVATGVYMKREVSLCLCMTCLHFQINQMNILYPEATRVIMYLGSGQNNVVLCRVPQQGGRDIDISLMVPFAKHMYHTKRIRQRVRLQSSSWELVYWLRLEAAIAVAADNAAFVEGRINDREEDGQEGERR